MKTNYFLYLEDDKVEVFKLQLAFQKINNTNLILKTFNNGEEGIKYLEKNLNNLPKIIILDLRMPKMNGFDFIKYTKKNIMLKRIPIIIFTSSENENDILLAYDLQVAGYFVKPFDLRKYNEIIFKIFEYWNENKTIN